MYWLGGKLQEGDGKAWRWVDGSHMDFQAWLPDSGTEATPHSPLCLGVRWRQSAAPRLHPSGLHWSAEKCSTVGGYVCKKRLGIDPLAKGSPTNAGDLPKENDEKGEPKEGQPHHPCRISIYTFNCLVISR
ncbi:hypothetical protein J437_LFUL018635 [Ladona fulva]|uniref:C-type lectin domain-containing protein n=1 Tax=Ladona fulva TaxID=123851 RepID=A0A8K0PBB0_LADFU|nr:hypothetical protein J437_LFUL018635 [Ladona fulva]